MLTDRMNVRVGNARRKKALMRAAAKAQAVAALGQRAGGGLGRSRFQSRLGFLLPGLMRGFGGGPGFNMDDPYMRAEQQPGAFDPAVASGVPGAGAGYDAGPPVAPPPLPGGGYGGGGDDHPNWIPGSPDTDPNSQQNQAVQNSMTGSSPGTTLDQVVPGYQAPAPVGYVWYQGRLVPAGLVRALNQGL